MQTMKRTWKRAIALFLAVVMAIAFSPNIAALADADQDVVVLATKTYKDSVGNSQVVSLTADDAVAVFDDAEHGATASVSGQTLTGKWALTIAGIKYAPVEEDKYDVAALDTAKPTAPGDYVAVMAVTRAADADMGIAAVDDKFMVTFAIDNSTSVLAIDAIEYETSAKLGEAKEIVDDATLVTKSNGKAVTGVTYTITAKKDGGDYTASLSADTVNAVESAGKLDIDVAATAEAGTYEITLTATKANYTAGTRKFTFTVANDAAAIQDITSVNATVAYGAATDTKVVDAYKLVTLDANGDAVTGVTYACTTGNAKITRTFGGDNPSATGATTFTLTVDKTLGAGVYSVDVTATKDGYDIASTTVKFTVVDADHKTPITTAATTVTMGDSVANPVTEVVAAVNKLDNANDDNEMAGDVTNSPVIGKFAFTGDKIYPTITLNDGTGDLVPGYDYEVLGSPQKNAGTYSMTIKGKGNYEGSLYVKWTIDKIARPSAITFDLTTLGKTNEDKTAIVGNFTYDGTTTVNAKAKVEETDNPTITYEYYKIDTLTSAEIGSAYTGSTNVGTPLAAAVRTTNIGATPEARADYKVPAPVDAGKYAVFAVVSGGGNYEEKVAGIIFEINPLHLYIVPDKAQGKTYGDGAEKITFKAYTYYNLGGEHKWGEYVNYADEGTEVGETSFVYGGKTVTKSDVRPNVPYEGTIDESNGPFLSRKKYGEAGGENAGAYDIIINPDATKRDGNYLLKHDTFADGVATVVEDDTTLVLDHDGLNNDKWTIAKRDLSEAFVRFVKDGKEVKELEYPNSTETRTPVYNVKDNITVWKNDAYAPDNEVVLKAGKDFTVSGDLSADKGGNYTITLTAKSDSNYTGSQDIKWSIAQSKNQGYEGVYKDSDWTTADVDTREGAAGNQSLADLEDGADKTSPLNKLNILKSGKYEVTYDGAPHYIVVKPIAVKVNGQSALESWHSDEEGALTTNDTAVIYYKNSTPEYTELKYEDTDGAGEGEYRVTDLIKVKPSEDWVEASEWATINATNGNGAANAPSFTKAGTYTVEYMIKSQDGLYADIIGTFTITIKPMQVTSRVQSIGAMTYDSEAATTASEVAAVGATRITAKSDTDVVPVRDNENIELKYTWPAGALETEGEYVLSVGPREFNSETLTAEWVAGYDLMVKQIAVAKANGVASPTYAQYKDYTAKDWDALTADQKTATKTYDKLTDAEKKKANETLIVTYVSKDAKSTDAQKAIDGTGGLNLADTLKLDEARCELRKNYNLTPITGTLKVMAGSLPFTIKVEQSKQAKDDEINTYWNETTGLAKLDDNGYSWKYGTYDTASSLIKLYADNGEELATTFASNATYDVLRGTEGGAFLPGYSNLPAASVDSSLRTLQPGIYRLRASVGSIPKKTSGGTADSMPFRVAEGILEIVDTEEALVGGSTSAGKAPVGLKAITGKEVSATEGYAAGENSYKLQYRYAAATQVDALGEDVEFGDDGYQALTATDLWVDTLAELKTEYVVVNGTPKYYPSGTSVWASTALGDDAIPVQVAVVPLVNNTPSATNFKTNNANALTYAANGAVNPVTVKIEVTPTEASENDKVANLTITYLAEDAGKDAVAGFALGENALGQPIDKLISKTYGTYTYNKKYANGDTITDDDMNYTPVVEANVVEGMTLVDYVENELLTNNGFAVGRQNTYGRYENMKFAPYMDAPKFTYDIMTKADDNVHYVVLNTLAKNPTEVGGGKVRYQGGVAADTGKPYGSQISDVGVYRAAYADALVDGISFDAELISDPNGIIATRKVLGKDEAIFGVEDDDQIKYTLAEELPKSGTANIKVTVHRTNYSDIEFYINLVVDGAGPEIGVFNVDLSKDTQTEINKDAKVTDYYANKALEFTVTANDVIDDGVYYTWTHEATTADKLEASYQLAKIDKFDESKGWYKLEGNTITSPTDQDGYVLYVRGEDESGNITYASSAKGFTIDTVKPVIRKANDVKEVYGEEAKTYLVELNGTASIAVVDQSDVTVSVAVGDGEYEVVKPNASTFNYDFTANPETYTIKAVDKAGNETIGKVDVNLAVDNVGNNINVVFEGDVFDLETVTDKTDTSKKLYVKSDNSGAISFANGTDLTEEDGKTYVYEVNGTRGEGKVEDGKLIVTKAGTFAIEVISEKNGIYGKTIRQANITVEKGTREVGIDLVEDKTAETPVAKAEFTRTEADNMKDFAKLTFTVKGAEPKDEYVKFIYFNKSTGAQLDAAPTTVGEYEVAVRIEDDGLFNATASENATTAGLNKRASYKIVDTHKVVVDNDTTKGTVKVVSGTTEMTAEQLLKTADRTPLTITATALEGYTFTGWTDVKGIELTEAEALKDTVTIAAVLGDVSLKANYVANIIITKQPADVKVYADEEAVFEVVATGNGDDDLTYQWQIKGKDDAAFRDIPDATASTYKIAKVATTNDGDSYRVVLTSKSTSKTLESDAAVLTV